MSGTCRCGATCRAAMASFHSRVRRGQHSYVPVLGDEETERRLGSPPWRTWEQASTLGTLVIVFIGVPIFINWLCANRFLGWRAGDLLHTAAKSSPQI